MFRAIIRELLQDIERLLALIGILILIALPGLCLFWFLKFLDLYFKALALNIN